MQPCKTGDQPYSDASPYNECSLIKPSSVSGIGDGAGLAMLLEVMVVFSVAEFGEISPLFEKIKSLTILRGFML